MKVIHIIGSLDESTGGPARSVPNTCIELAKLGVEIEIICQPSPNPVQLPDLANLKVRFFTYRQLKSFAKKLTLKDIDLIHLQHIWTPYIHIMAKAARQKGIPYLVTPRGMLEPWIMKRHPWKKKLAMLLYQKKDLYETTLIHATAQMEAENIRQLGFHNQITVIPNGIDLSKVPAPKTQYGSKKIVFLSRIHQKKGLELLLQAWKQLNVLDWTMEIAGEGEKTYVQQLQKQIQDEGLKNIQLVGAQYGNAKWDFLKSADIFVLPTYSENFGIVVAEALAIGVPVITTKETPWQELETKNCGWWIELSIEKLQQSLRDAIQTSTEELQKMGINGQTLIRNNYDIKRVASKLKDHYTKFVQ